MEILLIAIVAVVVGALIYYNRSAKSFDINNDGKVDVADAKAAVTNVVEGVKATADVNKDGKVDTADVKVVVEKTKTTAKKATTKAKAATRGRKPKAK
jgi:hypothetical protein